MGRMLVLSLIAQSRAGPNSTALSIDFSFSDRHQWTASVGVLGSLAESAAKKTLTPVGTENTMV